MLNKNLCISCINKYRVIKSDKEMSFPWCNRDDERWQSKIIACPDFKRKLWFNDLMNFNVAENNKDCPYKLEHLLKGEKNE